MLIFPHKSNVQALLASPAASAGLLERLDLADNTLGEEGGQALAETLSTQPSLTYVNLRDCELEVACADNNGIGYDIHRVCVLLIVPRGVWRDRVGGHDDVRRTFDCFFPKYEARRAGFPEEHTAS